MSDSDPCLPRLRLGPGVRLQLDPATGQLVLLHPEGILVLNETAAAILSRCDGAATMEELVATLAEEYDAPPEALRQDVIECLEDLQRRRLLVLVR